MKIAIIGTRGIPNSYGGFEQFAEIFSVYAVEQGHRVLVYSTHNHPYQESNYKGVEIIHQYNPEKSLGTFAQFIYDFKCIRDLKKRKVDVILQLGYTSSSVWGFLLPKNIPVFTNMDGLEWQRQKYSKSIQRFLKRAERWAVQSSDHLIADSIGIQKHLKETYAKDAAFIPYGAYVFNKPDEKQLETYQLKKYQYNLLIARLEPENNIETILEGVAQSKNRTDFLVIGPYDKNAFGKQMFQLYNGYKHIEFLGAIYNQELLNNLRYYSNLYCHGHSVGGTNPSLLEAMGSKALVLAHDNIFNRSVLQDDGLYFNNSQEVTTAIETKHKKEYPNFIQNNIDKVNTLYQWDSINQQYLDLLNHK